jgi:hypothetical protein
VHKVRECHLRSGRCDKSFVSESVEVLLVHGEKLSTAIDAFARSPSLSFRYQFIARDSEFMHGRRRLRHNHGGVVFCLLCISRAHEVEANLLTDV